MHKNMHIQTSGDEIRVQTLYVIVHFVLPLLSGNLEEGTGPQYISGLLSDKPT